MEILNSWEEVDFPKPGGVVIGAPEEQKRRLSASNSNVSDINPWKGRLEFVDSHGGSQSRRRPPRRMLLVERGAGAHTTGTIVNVSNRSVK
jgi:hypothetical protein